jgi:hypothetical protein
VPHATVLGGGVLEPFDLRAKNEVAVLQNPLDRREQFIADRSVLLLEVRVWDEQVLANDRHHFLSA